MPPTHLKTALALAGLLAVTAANAAATATAPDVDEALRRAHAAAHQGRLQEAQAGFRQVLQQRPDDVGALDGLGYALAWDGRHDEAEQAFQRAQALSPGDAEAAKGLAYVALWRGDHAKAVQRFTALAARKPPAAEPHVGLGQALSASGHRREAHDAFARALSLEPSRADALIGFRDTAPPGPRGQVVALGGLTSTDGHEEAGLRFAEAAFEPNEAWRVWLQYDDSLSLDNVALARDGVHAPTWYLGGRLAWGEGQATSLEAGYRSLPGDVTEWIARAEQTSPVGEITTLKVGGWVGFRDDDRTEASLHAGVRLALGGHLSLEPVVFYGRSGLAGESDLRGLLSAEWNFASGFALGAGLSAGRATSPVPEADGPTGSGFARLAFPIAGPVRGQLLASRERPAGAPDITLVALGLSATLGGRP